LLVGGVSDWGCAGAAGAEGGDLDGDGGAGEIVQRPEGGAAEDDGEFGALEGEADLVGEVEALGNGGGLGGVPGDIGVRVFEVVGCEGRGDDVNAVAAGGGVEDEAGGGVRVVADLGALVGGEGDGGVDFVGGDDGEAAGGEEGAEAGCEGEGDVFFEEVVGEVGSGVGASVSGIEEDDGAGGGLLGLRGDGDEARQDGKGEACGDVSGKEGQGRFVDCI